MVAPEEIIRLAVKAKQAADLLYSTFNQFIIHEFLQRHDIDTEAARLAGYFKAFA